MNVKYFCSLVALLICVATSSFAQKQKGDDDVWKKSATVKAYKTAMKEKRYPQAKSDIDAVMKKFEEARKDAQLYMMKADALTEMIVAENRKIYLKQRPDTALYFNYIYELYETALQCDSLEVEAEKAKQAIGKSYKFKYRKTMADKMMTYRSKVLTAGKFFFKKKDYKSSYKFLDIYTKTKTSPVLSASSNQSIINTENDQTEVASLAVLSAYASCNHQGVISYLVEALKDKSKEKTLIELGSKSAAALGDTTEMVNLLENGFYNYPESDYFFMTLVKHYNENLLYDKALTKATRMTELFANNRDYWFVRAKEEMLLERYTAAAASFAKCVELKPDDAESFSALGNIYLIDARDKYAHFNLSRTDPEFTKRKNEITTSYERSLENFEQARQFASDKPELWIDGLREVYFKLNKGKELKALEK